MIVFRASWYLWKLVTVLLACGGESAALGVPSAPRSPSTGLALLGQTAFHCDPWPPLPLALGRKHCPLTEAGPSLTGLPASQEPHGPAKPSEPPAFSEFWKFGGSGRGFGSCRSGFRGRPRLGSGCLGTWQAMLWPPVFSELRGMGAAGLCPIRHPLGLPGFGVGTEGTSEAAFFMGCSHHLGFRHFGGCRQRMDLWVGFEL